MIYYNIISKLTINNNINTLYSWIVVCIVNSGLGRTYYVDLAMADGMG
jgi:hypothetical protein